MSNVELPVTFVTVRSSQPDKFLGKGLLKICSKFRGEHPCRSVISINLLAILQHGCSFVNLRDIFKPPIPKNTSDRLHLYGRCNNGSYGGNELSHLSEPFTSHLREVLNAKIQIIF